MREIEGRTVGRVGAGKLDASVFPPPPISQIYLLSSEISFFKIRKKYLQREEREINISKNKHFIIYSYKKMQNPNIVLYAPHTAKIEDKPIPTLSSPHDVVIRINYIGVCGSDVFPPPPLPPLPILPPFSPPTLHHPPLTQPQGPLLAPRLPRTPHKPLHRDNNGPRSLRYNPLCRPPRNPRRTRRPRSPRARIPLPPLPGL